MYPYSVNPPAGRVTVESPSTSCQCGRRAESVSGPQTPIGSETRTSVGGWTQMMPSPSYGVSPGRPRPAPAAIRAPVAAAGQVDFPPAWHTWH
eukprot:330179-Hanusia_phi.AAC.1